MRKRNKQNKAKQNKIKQASKLKNVGGLNLGECAKSLAGRYKMLQAILLLINTLSTHTYTHSLSLSLSLSSSHRMFNTKLFINFQPALP